MRTGGNPEDRNKALVELMLAFLLAFQASASAQSPRPSQINSAKVRLVLISIPDCRLAILEDGRVVRVFAVAVGADNSPSPTGSFQIARRLENPTYYHPGVEIPPGKNNPLGPRWIGLNKKGYGIHGTNEPRSIGRAASHGCIRMRNRDIVEFFSLVRVNDSVEIRGERDAQTAEIFGGEAGGMRSLIADGTAEELQTDSGQ